MDSAELLSRLVADCIEAWHRAPVEERDEAVDDVALVLQQVIMERLAAEWDWDSRFVSLDGLKTLSVESDGDQAVKLVGAFYLLEGRRHRMLPVEADLTVAPGAESLVRIGGADSVFDIPQSERQFVRGIESARWRHTLVLRLA